MYFAGDSNTLAKDYSARELAAATRAKVIAEARPLLTAPEQCRALWTALQAADYKHEGGLNDAAVAVMFAQEPQKYSDLLLVQNSEELLQLLDENEDGVVNEDEQLLIFSLIKERMQQSAEALSACHEYVLFKEMMKAVRVLENDIVRYQETLRQKTQEKELKAYNELGEEKLAKFRTEWKQRFEAFHQERAAALRELKDRQRRQREDLELALQRERESARVKPSARTRNLAEEEKLVALYERFNEAGKIRNELRMMEQADNSRFEAEVQHEHEKRRKLLADQHAREEQQLNTRFEKTYNRLKITSKQKLSRLNKEVKLYINDITKNHNLAQRLARKLGETRDELRRTKQKAREMMEIMSESKSVPKLRQLSTAPSLPRIGSLGTTQSTLPTMRVFTSPLHASRKVVTKFGIASDVVSTDRPVNTVSSSLLKPTSTKEKLAAQLISKHTDKSQLQSLSRLYSDSLVPLSEFSG